MPLRPCLHRSICCSDCLLAFRTCLDVFDRSLDGGLAHKLCLLHRGSDSAISRLPRNFKHSAESCICCIKLTGEEFASMRQLVALDRGRGTLVAAIEELRPRSAALALGGLRCRRRLLDEAQEAARRRHMTRMSESRTGFVTSAQMKGDDHAISTCLVP